ncbi:MAG: UvrD-helicase domain-containing protein, partial [Saprospiraceae bacterium]|nr:UvrD-helicase domain-containing protein [Saprospiraceae bacterium]
MMRNFPEKFIAYKASAPIDDVDSLEILKNILTLEIQKKNIENLTNDFDPFLYLRDIKSRINILKQEAITPSEFEIIIAKQERNYAEILSEIKPTLKKYETTKDTQEKHIKKLFELNHIYKIYLETLKKEEKYDFSDMINYVVEVFENDEEVKYFYAEK